MSSLWQITTQKCGLYENLDLERTIQTDRIRWHSFIGFSSKFPSLWSSIFSNPLFLPLGNPSPSKSILLQSRIAHPISPQCLKDAWSRQKRRYEMWPEMRVSMDYGPKTNFNGPNVVSVHTNWATCLHVDVLDCSNSHVHPPLSHPITSTYDCWCLCLRRNSRTYIGFMRVLRLISIQLNRLKRFSCSGLA